jgi:hypothetical protein
MSTSSTITPPNVVVGPVESSSTSLAAVVTKEKVGLVHVHLFLFRHINAFLAKHFDAEITSLPNG